MWGRIFVSHLPGAIPPRMRSPDSDLFGQLCHFAPLLLLQRNNEVNPESVKLITKSVVLCRGVGQSVKHNLLAAFRYLLRPLVRIAIRNGIAYPDFAGMVQDAYVNVAAAQLKGVRDAR